MLLLGFGRPKRHVSVALALVAFLLCAGAAVLGAAEPVKAQSQFTNLVSYRVTGAPNYTSPGSEAFWNTIPWTTVPLAASVAPGGGHTSILFVKSANDGFNIYMLFQWNDSVGPSFGSATEVYRSTNGSLLPLNPATTANVTQLFYNSTYYYPDRVAMLWFLENAATRQQSPAMMLGSNGAITGGAANIWHWQSNPTDNDPNDGGFPGGYTNPAGTAVFPNNNASFAEDDYTNTTGFYVIAGNFGPASPNLDPYGDPFIVRSGNYYSNMDKTWTVEMVRSFTTPDSQYRVQLTTGSTNYVAFAVWNGKLGESSHLKSVSQWYTITISDQAPSLPLVTPTQSGISPTLAAAAGVGLLIVGVIVGVTLRQKPQDAEE
jgi:DMSO reductase family type II enzyme heme b subunit